MSGKFDAAILILTGALTQIRYARPGEVTMADRIKFIQVSHAIAVLEEAETIKTAHDRSGKLLFLSIESEQSLLRAIAGEEEK